MNDTLKNLLVREVKIEDAEALSRIECAITKSPPKTDFFQIIEHQIREGDHVSFIAEVDGEVAGYMISSIVSGGFGEEKSAWIVMIGVSPRYMGQGIGKQLADKIFRVFREKGIKQVFTSVRWDSVDLLSFFKTLGFDRSDFINLRKELDLTADR
jgi:ribosomal protein S18 acetylase RimI-like enzyme